MGWEGKIKMNKTNVATGKYTKCPVCYHSFQVPEKVRVLDATQFPKCKKLLELAGAGGNDVLNDLFPQVR